MLPAALPSPNDAAIEMTSTSTHVPVSRITQSPSTLAQEQLTKRQAITLMSPLLSRVCATRCQRRRQLPDGR